MAKKKEKNASPILVQNRKAHYDYHIIETYEAGLALVGTEVKALRERQGSIQEAYCKPVKGELMMIGSHINEYDKGNRFNHDPERNRKLLMHRNEIIRLSQKIERKGLTLIPLKLYLKRGKVKVELGLCEGKHSYDKSAALKEKAVKKEAELSFEKARRR